MRKIINATGQGGACQYDCNKTAISLNTHLKNILKNVRMCQPFFRKIAKVYMSILPPVLIVISILFIIGGML